MKRLLICACLLLSSCGQQNIRVQQVWVAPTGLWQGLELRATDEWGGWGPNRRLGGQFLEVRCRSQPDTMSMRRSYWPGSEWSGKVIWNEMGVTYIPKTNHPNIQNLTFRAADMAQSLLCLTPEVRQRFIHSS